MAKIDTSVWNNKERLAERLKSTAMIIMSITFANGVFMYFSNNWFMLFLNALTFISGLLVFISYTKFKKLPPQ